MENVFDVEQRHQTEKCMVAVVSQPESGCCRSCRKPSVVLIDGCCTHCAPTQGVNPLELGSLSMTSAT